MPTQSEVKWSDKHQRYFRHIIGDDGVILDTKWLPQDSVDAAEAEDEASKQSTIPSNPAGDPRGSGKGPASHPDSGDVSNPYSFPQSRSSTGGGYLPTQPEYDMPSALPNSREDIAEGSAVWRIPEMDLPPVEPPPKWPPTAAPAPAQASGLQRRAVIKSASGQVVRTYDDYDTSYQRYKRLVYDYTTSRWVFSQWMPATWQPSPAAATIGSHRPHGNESIDENVSPYATWYGSTTSSVGQARSRADTSGYRPDYEQSAASHAQYAGPSSYSSAFSTSSGFPTYSASSETSAANLSAKSMPKGKGRHMMGTWGQPNEIHYEKVDPTYYVRAKDFFLEGRVLSIIMKESAESKPAETITDYNSSSSIVAVGYRDNLVYTSVRRFVVVRQMREFCYACPIFTYSGRATTKPGVRPAENAIAYSDGREPTFITGESGITKASIGVTMAAGEGPLHVASRIYFGIHHPIQYNVKVKDIGQVLHHHVPALRGN